MLVDLSPLKELTPFLSQLVAELRHLRADITILTEVMRESNKLQQDTQAYRLKPDLLQESSGTKRIKARVHLED